MNSGAQRHGSPSDTGRLDSLTGLRFFAALGVVIYHLPLFCGVAFYGQRASPWGYLGVQFFFVLSGFVLVWTARSDDSPTAFWRRRFARVYPLYLVMFVPGVVLALIGRSIEPVSAGAVVLSLPMLQAWVPAGVSGLVLHNANAPSWSLSNEAFFYAVFPLVIHLLRPQRRPRLQAGRPGSGPLQSGLLRAGAAVVAAMVGVFGVLDVIGHGVASLYYYPAFQLGFFLVGMLLGEAVRRGLTAPPRPDAAAPGRGLATSTRPSLFVPPLWLSLAAMIAFAVVVVTLGHHGVGLIAKPAFVELLALPFIVVLIASAAASDLRGAFSLFAHPGLVKLGVWSYALYLVQYPCFLVIRVIWPGGLSRSQGPGSLEALAVLVVLIAVAALAHHWIEGPWNARLRPAPASVITDQDEMATA